jgi:hypothetical protein
MVKAKKFIKKINCLHEVIAEIRPGSKKTNRCMENLYEKKGTCNLFGDEMPILSIDKLGPRFPGMPMFSSNTHVKQENCHFLMQNVL